MTVEVILVALLAGLAGGAVAAVVMGAIQAWMAGGKGSRTQTFMRHTPGFEHAPRANIRMGSAQAMGPFDRFSDRGKRVLALAQDEAIRHNHNYIGTEHVLCALIREGDTVPARALTSVGIDLTKIRSALDFIVGRGDQTTSPSEITLSPRTKKVIEFAIAEAGQMGQSHVGPEHFLLGLVDEGEGIASGILESLGVPLETLRAKVLELLSESGTAAPAGYAPPFRRHHTGPFDRFSNRAKRALALAQDEAVRMGHNYIGPEHLLLGLARLTGVGQADQAMKRIFDELGLTVESLRAELAEIIPHVEQRTPQWEVVLSPETKEIFEVVVQESGPDIGVLPEHLLLAIVRNDESFAVQMLARLNVTAERVRTAVGH
ncbi:MAG: Clp protease N-terminal domain-containing protein [Chloroflexota bacterium]